MRSVADDEQTATRILWDHLPLPVQVAIEQRVGAAIRSAENQRGGFSHGMAARLEFIDSTTVFVKALPSDDALAPMYRTEAETSARLPQTVPAPRLRFTLEVDGWFVAAFADVAGRHPRLDQAFELAAALSAVARLAQVLTPSPLQNIPSIADACGSEFVYWREFAEHGPPPDLDRWCVEHLDQLAELESQWCEPAAGRTLLHTDLRPDNLLLTADGTVVVVDWAWPCVGASWVDLASMAPSIAVCGLNPDPILAEHPATRDAKPAAISAFVCALLGYWERNSRKPPPPRSPNLRRYQARTATVTREWLSNRIARR